METNLKENYLEKIEEIKNIINKYDLDFNQEDNETIEEIKNFALKVLMLGVFNAGKSTLLNKFLNDTKFLKVNSEAETAVPCELKYSTDEKTLIHKTNGKVVRELKDYNVRAEEGAGIEYLEKFLDIKKLKDLGDIILVDMPGLDSSNDAHEEAINKYISAGAYYILLTDPENGGIKDSTGKFLNKILKYPDQFSVLLTKTDLSSKEHCEDVINDLKDQFREKNLDIFIGQTKRGDYRDFERILENIEYNNIFKNIYRDRVLDIINLKASYLTTILKNKDLDVSEIEENIKINEENFIEIEKKIEKEKEKFNNNQIKNEIVEEFRSRLNSHFSEFKSAAKKGEGAFNSKAKNIASAELNSIIESKLKQKVEYLIQDLQDFALDLPQGDFSSLSIDLEIKIDNFQIFTDTLKGIFKAMLIPIPILDLFMIAREIFKSKERREEENEELEESVRGAISEVANSVVPQVTKIVDDAKLKVFNTLNKKCKNEQEEIDRILKELIEKKKEEEEEFQKSVTDLESDIAKLKSLEL
jgi:hypothetical protein